MKVKVWADTHSTGLLDDLGGYIYQSETTITDKTWAQLQDWVTKYDDVILMDDEERSENIELINELDKIGLELTKKIKQEWTYNLQGVKISFEYYSEGKMDYIMNKE